MACAEQRLGRPVPLVLHRWLDQGVSTVEIASRLGVTPRTVRNWLRAAGLDADRGGHAGVRRRGACTPRKMSQVEAYYGRPAAVVLCEWRRQGKSVEVIAGLCGVGRSTVYRWLAQWVVAQGQTGVP